MTTAKAKAVRKTQPGKRAPTAAQAAVQEALEVTWTLKGHLKNAQVAYLRVGVLLAEVRDKKLYAALHHPDLESYAAERLHLARTSLYKYMRVYDWVAAYHKEWLEPKPKGFIPDLADVADMISIESELAKRNLNPTQRGELQALLKKALDGQLRDGDLGRYRRQGSQAAAEGLKAFLSKLRLLRMRGSQIKSLPPEVLPELDAAIEILANAIAVQRAG